MNFSLRFSTFKIKHAGEAFQPKLQLSQQQQQKLLQFFRVKIVHSSLKTAKLHGDASGTCPLCDSSSIFFYVPYISLDFTS